MSLRGTLGQQAAEGSFQRYPVQTPNGFQLRIGALDQPEIERLSFPGDIQRPADPIQKREILCKILTQMLRGRAVVDLVLRRTANDVL